MLKPTQQNQRSKSTNLPDNSYQSTRKNSMVPSQSENIRVFIRIKPDNDDSIVNVIDKTTIVIQSPASLEQRAYKFNQVFDSNSTNTLFNEACLPVINGALQGENNGCILTYGQTGSGKTYTMGLLQEMDEVNPQGVVPNALKYIFQQIMSQQGKQSQKYIYNYTLYLENIEDLLNPQRSKLKLRRQEENGDPYVQGLVLAEVQSFNEAVQVVNLGLKYRQTAKQVTTLNKTCQQNLNSNSSRSHTILSIYINSFIEDLNTGEQYYAQNRVQLVDLAGSERTKKTQSKGLRMEEAKAINTSLAALGNVICALAHQNQTFIPFRDSKLTQLLQSSLQGESKVVLIGTISAAHDCVPETISTLQFAQRCKEIKFRPITPTKMTQQEDLKQIISLFEQRTIQQDQQISHLQSMLQNNPQPQQIQQKELPEHSELAQYLVKLLGKLNQHASKLQNQVKQESEKVHKDTLSYLIEEVKQKNINQAIFDKAHNVIAATQILSQLDEQYPSTFTQLETFANIDFNLGINQIILQVQKVSQQLIQRMNDFANWAKNIESIKRELVLSQFLQQQREIELENWMKAIGYLYKIAMNSNHNNLQNESQLREKVFAIINEDNFYQEMDRFKKKIFQYTQFEPINTLQNTLETLRKYTNNTLESSRIHIPKSSKIDQIYQKELNRGSKLIKEINQVDDADYVKQFVSGDTNKLLQTYKQQYQEEAPQQKIAIPKPSQFQKDYQAVNSNKPNFMQRDEYDPKIRIIQQTESSSDAMSNISSQFLKSNTSLHVIKANNNRLEDQIL